MMIYILTGVIGIIIIFVLILITKYNHIKDITHKLDTSKKSISNLSGKQLNIFIKANKILEEEYQTELPVTNRKNLDEDYDLELDKNLKDLQNKFDKLLADDNKIKKDEKLLEIKNELLDTSEDIIGLKEYYNRNVKSLNKLSSKTLYKLAFKLFKVKKYETFDVRKITDLEILKN